jgi:hypothetical protein
MNTQSIEKSMNGTKKTDGEITITEGAMYSATGRFWIV